MTALPPGPALDDVDGLLRLLAEYQDAHTEYQRCIDSCEYDRGYFCWRYEDALEKATAAFATGLGAVIDSRVTIRLQALGLLPAPIPPEM